jgi:hypothetical protein
MGEKAATFAKLRSGASVEFRYIAIRRRDNVLTIVGLLIDLGIAITCPGSDNAAEILYLALIGVAIAPNWLGGRCLQEYW